MKTVQPSKAHTEFRDDMVATMRKHQHMKPDEMLAVASYFVGQLVALQDQRKITPAMAMEIVGSNIEAGNQQAMAEVRSAAGSTN